MMQMMSTSSTSGLQGCGKGGGNCELQRPFPEAARKLV